MSSKMRCWSSLGGVSIVCKSKVSEYRLKLVGQSTDLFPSRYVWLIWTCQLIFFRSRMRWIKVWTFPLMLHFHVTMSTKSDESLSTCKCVIPCLRAISMQIYMSHISACNASRTYLTSIAIQTISTAITEKVTTSQEINWAFIIEFNPTLLGCLLSNENSVSKLRSSSYVCLFTIINLHSHLKNHINWIKRSMELLFKNVLIPPHPQVPTCYHKDSLPLNFVS